MRIFKSNPDKVRTPRTAAGQAPRWVSWFTDIGRPLSAIVVMVLCAPGERHLALLAGWGPNLSWGMAGLLVMYAGIAAVVATVRPKGAPGKRTAVVGAILSLLLAMAAQPVSHYFVTGWMTADPRPPFWLVTVVSCVPPFVMGHLLHLAADPGVQPDTREASSADLEDAVRRYEAEFVRPADLLADMSATANSSFRPDSGQPDTADAVNSEPVTVPDEPDVEADIPWSNPAEWTADMADEPDVPDTGQESGTLSEVGPQVIEGGHETVPSGYEPNLYYRAVRDADGTVRMVDANGAVVGAVDSEAADRLFEQLQETHPDWNFTTLGGVVSAHQAPDSLTEETMTGQSFSPSREALEAMHGAVDAMRSVMERTPAPPNGTPFRRSELVGQWTPPGADAPLSGYRDPVESALMYPATVSGETPDSIRELADGVMRMAGAGQPDSPDTPTDTGQDMPGVMTNMIPAPAPTPGRAAISGSELSAWIRDLWNLDPDMAKADVRQAVRDRFPDIKADTVRKAVTRVEEAIRT